MKARFTFTAAVSLALTGCSAAFAPISDSGSCSANTLSCPALYLRPSQADQLAKAASNCYFSEWKDRQDAVAAGGVLWNEKEKAVLDDDDSSEDCNDDRTFKWFNVAPTLYNMAFLQREKKH